MNPPPLQKTSGLAVTSLVLGVLGLCCPLLASIAAVICGHIARGGIRKSEGALTGGGIALGGIILGYIGIVLGILGILFSSMLYPKMEKIVGVGMGSAHAQQIHLAVQKMVADGAIKGDKSLGWPADAGITTVTELKKRLVDNGYLSAEEADSLEFENFLIGNLSESDPSNTVFVRLRPELFEEWSVIVRKDGQNQVLPGRDEVAIEDPPRDPPYLEP